MYFAMDNMGEENVTRVQEARSEAEKWRCVAQIAADFGFAGIQLTTSYYQTLGLSLTSVPDYIAKNYRLVYHLGGVYQMAKPDDERKVGQSLAESLEVAVKVGAEDVSLHPPVLANLDLGSLSPAENSPDGREESKGRLHALLEIWLPRFRDQGIPLSLETHVTSSFFVFTGIRDFRDFVRGLPGLGVLVDICHNYYDGYDLTELLADLGQLRVTGFHLSDAIREKDFNCGTHLPAGQGEIDFRPLLSRFGETKEIYGALEVKGPAQGISDSLAYLRSLR